MNGLRQSVELRERRHDGVGRSLAEAADRGVAHHLRRGRRAGASSLVAIAIAARARRCERLLLAHGADAAGDALAARLVAEEGGDAGSMSPRSTVSSKHEHDARSERGPASRAPSKVSGMSSWSGRDERAGRAAEQHRLRASAARYPAGQLEQLAERRAELELVEARPARRGPRRRRASDRSIAACRCGVRRAALEDDGGHVDERLDVVDDRRLAEQADLDRERRLVARLAAVALDRLEERRLLAADIGAGAARSSMSKAKRGPSHPRRAPRGPLDRVLQPLVRERVLAAHVEKAFSQPVAKRGDGHRLDQRERVAAPSARGP